MAYPDIYWKGKSGKRYSYWIRDLEDDFMAAPGNYVFAKEVSPGRWKPVYIGQTNNLNDRLAHHERKDCALRHGATHVHAHTSHQAEDGRKAEEEDLIQEWHPPCNESPVES